MKILTLNTWGGSGPWKERWEIIFSALESHAPDLVAFQEVFDENWSREIAKRAAFPYFSCPNSLASGLMLLSRFPIQRSELRAMKRKSPFEDYSRHALWAQVECAGRTVHVFTTHLSWLPEDGETRKAQVRELRDWMAEKAGLAETVLTGDLNAPPDSAEIRWLLEASGLVDAFDALHPGEPGFTWDHRNAFTAEQRVTLPDRRIDYILVKGESLPRHLHACNLVFERPDRTGVFASDHFGLMAEFGGPGK